MISSEYTIQAFDQTFATIGGMAGFVYALIAFVIGSYQEFAFENSMNRSLYTQDKDKFERTYYPEDEY